MSQLILTAASGVGAAIGKAGLGAAIGKTIASTAATFAAGYVDRLIFGPQKRRVETGRLESFQLQASHEGAAIKRIYGRARTAGQIIWAANFKETLSETTERSGGKGGAPAAVETTTTEYLYSMSFALGLCEGVIERIGRVWINGKDHDITQFNFRLYKGDETQTPDALIEAIEGAGEAPAFRGLAYIVFEDMPLKEFGNAIPQFKFEIERSLKENDAGALENALTAVTLIPGSGEFVYGQTRVLRQAGEGRVAPENTHNNQGGSDFTASLNTLNDTAPNVAHASLVVSWFGDSLNASSVKLRPGVEIAAKETAPYLWRAGGVDRTGAKMISTLNGAPAYGGTPADLSVREAIGVLNARGMKVLFHPFILMDTPGFDWRGRISVGTNDKTDAATTNIAAFFGTASPSDYSVINGVINYSGPNEWSFRRMILHYAHLCALAGGVDAFLLGSELRGVTTARDAQNAYPAIAQLKALAGDVRSILGSGTEISYGADWSEYFGHQPADGSGDVYYHLDDFWSDANVDFIGIDNYMPLADWRDGFSHLDALDGAKSQYDLDYLHSNIEGGEGFDWFYANQSDRDGQIRTPISDGAFGEPWVFRYKDLKNWWLNAHHNRPGGVRDSAPTSWAPQSKPIIFTEAGAPAVDKAANQPNVFVDAKSVESAIPYHSNGNRDDLAQRRTLEALISYWRKGANNPVSSVYGAPMVDTDRQYIYAWDARPFPEFPARTDVWGDAANWEKGHWLNGRLGRAPLDLLVGALAREIGFVALDASRLTGAVTGYIVDRPMSPREAIDPLADIFQFDMIESGDKIRFQPRSGAVNIVLSEQDLAARAEAAFTHRRNQETDLPAAFRLGFLSEAEDYGSAVVEARDPAARPLRETGAEIPAVMAPAEAEARARSILADAWVMRETLSLVLPPSQLKAEPGDIVIVNEIGVDREFRITEIEDNTSRTCELVRVSRNVYDAPLAPAVFTPPPSAQIFGPPVWELMDLPLIREDDDPAAPWLAVYADPWPGGAALYRDPSGDFGEGEPVLAGRAPARAVMGRLASALPAGASGRWDGRTVDVTLLFGSLSSRAEIEVYAGANLFAVQSNTGGWELAQFKTAALLQNGDWRLSELLRGQGGTEAEAFSGAGIGARFVLLTPAVTQAGFSSNLRTIPFDWMVGPETENPGTANFVTKSAVINNRALMPLSPVRLSARKETGGIRLSWIRRTRMGGDSWAGEVALGETSEQYRLEIFNGPALVRSVQTFAPEYFYADADIDADFAAGGPGAMLNFSVVQISAAIGDGVPANANVAVE